MIDKTKKIKKSDFLFFTKTLVESRKRQLGRNHFFLSVLNVKYPNYYQLAMMTAKHDLDSKNAQQMVPVFIMIRILKVLSIRIFRISFKKIHQNSDFLIFSLTTWRKYHKWEHYIASQQIMNNHITLKHNSFNVLFCFL